MSLLLFNIDPDVFAAVNRQVEGCDPLETGCSPARALNVYLGWITIASIANMAVTLVSVGYMLGLTWCILTR
jgi:hypothetical protein